MAGNEERILAAIMFTDMVGYSALAQENEALALELLEEHREILRSFFAKHGGREVDTAGDGFFVEFSSALEAVNCAIEIQKALWERNKRETADKHIRIRVGIHLGDVVHKADSVLGDGVNIAARIEPLAEPCSICVSEDIARQVQNKIDFPIEKIETTKLKNIKLPVEVYAICLPWLKKQSGLRSVKINKQLLLITIASIAVILLIMHGINYLKQDLLIGSAPVARSAWQNSIAVLPFTDMSLEQDQEYFCVGMTEQILTNLAQLNQIKVIARTSVMKYKDTQKTIPEIGNELDVQNILEGSVRKFGNRLRVTAQLVRSRDGSHIWAKDYDKEYTELFAIQDDISKSIADELSQKLSVNETNVLKTLQPVRMEAYEYFLKAEYIHRHGYWSSYSIDSFKESEDLFLKAIEADPQYAPSYAGLADLYNTFWNTHSLSARERQKYLELQQDYINTAYEIDDQSADVNRVMGWVYRAKGDIEKSMELMLKAVQLDANDPENIRSLGICYDNMGLRKHALKCYSRCIHLDPVNAKDYYYLAGVYFHLGDFQQSKFTFDKALKLDPDNPKFMLFYIMLLLQLGEYTEAKALLSRYDQIHPENENRRFIKAMFYVVEGQKDKALQVDLTDESKLIVYLYLGMDEQAIDLIEVNLDKMQASRKSKYLLYENYPNYRFLKQNSRFKKILDVHKAIYEDNLNKYGHIDF